MSTNPRAAVNIPHNAQQTATAQKFDHGAVLLRQPDSKAEDGFAYRLIQPDAFQQTYTAKDGSAIVLDKMARQSPMVL